MLRPSLIDLIKTSLKSILKNKVRTFLTSLGIIIGVTSVILLTSIGNGLKSYVTQQFEQLGSNTIFVTPGKIFNNNGGFNRSDSSMMVQVSFAQKDISNISRKLKTSQVSPLNQTSTKVKYKNTIKKDISIVTTDEKYGQNSNSLPSQDHGRWFTEEENKKKANVAVLGFKIAEDLFGTQNPLNKKITIDNKSFKVVGVVDKKGSTFGGPSLDDHVYIPFETGTSLLSSDKVGQIYIKIPDQSEIENSKTIIKKLLLEDYDEDSFTVFDSSQLLSSINSIIGTLTIALTGIAAISLVVGGIGIMNIMLVSVTERTKEIGLRKAIGAQPRAILMQFLIEAVILSSIGGASGIGLGAMGTFFINKFFPAKITYQSISLAFGVSSIVGIVFGVAPARRASKLSPIEALRYE